MRLTVEQALHQAADKAEFLRFATDLAAGSDTGLTEQAALSGLADICADLSELLWRVSDALDSPALNRELLAERCDAEHFDVDDGVIGNNFENLKKLALQLPAVPKPTRSRLGARRSHRSNRTSRRRDTASR